MNSSTSSMSCTLILTLSWFPALILVIFVFYVLIPLVWLLLPYEVLFWISNLIEDSSATLSAKSRLSSFDVSFHLILFSPCPLILFFTQSITSQSKIGILTYYILAWCTCTVLLCLLLHNGSHHKRSSPLLQSSQRSHTSHNHPLSQKTKSKAFLKSTKFRYSDAFHSLTCSMMFLNVKTCYVVTLPFLQPAFFSFSSGSWLHFLFIL